MKNSKRIGIGIVIALLTLTTLSLGCTDEDETLNVAIQNDTNIEQKINIYVDGDDVGYIYIKAGEKEFVDTGYNLGEHFVKIIGENHQLGENVKKNIQFDLHQDGSVTYFEW